MIKVSKSYKTFQVINILVMIFVIIITVYPFVYLIAQSFSSEQYVYAGEITFYPKGFTTATYKEVMSEKFFWIGYKNTIIYTVLATAVSLFMTTIFAYALSKKRLKGRKFFLGFAVFTMFFNGGLIPNYLLVKYLGMRNTIWSMIIPGAISTWNLMIMKTFFEGLPNELEEAASVDGLNTYGILLKIVLPLSKPILSTMALFYAVGNWNSWFGAFLYMDKKELFPVTLYLRNIIAGAQQTDAASGMDSDKSTQIAATIKSASMVLTVLPILCVYPFIQKYFVTGVMIGSVKG
ncbi:carbohydrate ABC transporter membrane protein 2, CUT1 family [Clostridium sp. USBA 49]|uniref:carbohydrate ABC transporter permease n=1 Tax=Clostridium sp. USBA 49 TaxID=1881060 RepID=UPI0009CE9A47|nr:carbohydrate ABC transporter permease [Clostridium sp. USBA 49]SKA74245.1 carbohydrate ABC transporter membrane protein 2, CUT1 family [Clostridium sp. USBA 49]